MKGTLNLVSVGPGFSEHITPRAVEALDRSDLIVAYEPYLKFVCDRIKSKKIFTAPIGQEMERARTALEFARAGQKVALVSGGDVGIYAMAALAFEEMKEDDVFDVQIVPGITSAVSCASLLGSPLSHDFATLSLSDLLCPWSEIEYRAHKIAEADLCLVLYNVQSVGRRDGIYKILSVLLKNKSKETLCGVVRSAYRPDQTTYTCSLGELAKHEFDMYTTIVVGNRYTRSKRGWMYTPRVYTGHKSESSNVHEHVPLQTGSFNASDKTQTPNDAVWVFSGTSDGNELASTISATGLRVIVSVATEQGYRLTRERCKDAFIVTGGNGEAARHSLLAASQARCIVDATHPFAGEMSRQLIRLSCSLELPYIRYERPAVRLPQDVIACESVREAVLAAIELGSRIFLATGSKDLELFLRAQGSTDKQWFIRVTPDASVIQRVIDLSIPPSNICAMHGPYTQDFNELMWKQWKIDCVVTKESGERGGFTAKAAAAHKLGIPMIVIRRPVVDYPCVRSSGQEILNCVTAMEFKK